MSGNPPSKRALFVSYLFPPVGGVGVLRVAKFVKYLPECGWAASVLTVENPSVPLFDESVLGDIPSETIIRKARTREPGYAFKSAVAATETSPSLLTSCKTRLKAGLKRLAEMLLQPDAQILWHPAAVRTGMKLLRDVPHDVIVASGPPFTNLLVGAALSHHSGVPLVLDYRDEWDVSNAYWENKRPGRLASAIQRRMQQHALRQAAAVTATTPSSARTLAEVAGATGSHARSIHIYNGFDPSDFPSEHRFQHREDFGNGVERFRMSFAGTLWELTSIEPFVRGLERLAERAPSLMERLEIVFAGRRAGRQDELIERLDLLPCRTVRLGYLEHSAAIRLMMTSDSLLLLLSDVPHADRVISSKIFEYMAARRPIFAVSPHGDQNDILLGHPGATVCSPRDPDAIADALAARLEEHRCGIVSSTDNWDFRHFERRTQAGQLAALLDEIVSGRCASASRGGSRDRRGTTAGFSGTADVAQVEIST